MVKKPKNSYLSLPFVRFVYIYSIACILIVWNFEILQSFRMETTISFLVCCLISSLIHYFDYQHIQNSESNIRSQNLRLHFWIGSIFLVALPLMINKKVEAIWYNVETQAQFAHSLATGFLDMGEARLPNHKNPINTAIFTQRESTPVICDLITRDQCPYTEHFGQSVELSLSTRRLLPYQHEPVVFELKTPNFHFSKQQHIEFYKQQQYAVYLYFIFIYFPSIYLFFRMRKVLLQHYFEQVKNP